MRYSKVEKRQALEHLEGNDGDFPLTSAETGIPAATLRVWERRHREERAKRALEQIEKLHEELAENSLQLARALGVAIEGAPLNQLASALGSLVDRYLKVDEYLANVQQNQQEQVIRVEYKYPDGSIHDAPPWSNDDFEIESTLPYRRVWSSLRQNGGGESADYGMGAEGRDVLVAGADVPDGEPDMARAESGTARHYGAGD